MALSLLYVPGEETVHRVSARKKRGQPPPKYQPNLVPLIDVLFLLLLFFLLGTKFRQTEGDIPSTLPQAQSLVAPGELPPLLPLRIHVRTAEKTGAIVYEIAGFSQNVAGPQQLYELLASRRRSTSDEVPVIISPGTDVPWGDVVETFNQAVRAKFRNIGFAPAAGG
jgi:biopolymer transport protein ExbD